MKWNKNIRNLINLKEYVIYFLQLWFEFFKGIGVVCMALGDAFNDMVVKVVESRKHWYTKMLAYLAYVFYPIFLCIVPVGLIVTVALCFIGFDQATWSSYDLGEKFKEPTMKNLTIKGKESLLMDAVVAPLEREMNKGLGYTANDFLSGLQFLDNKKNFQMGLVNAHKALFPVLSKRTTNKGRDDIENEFTRRAHIDFFKEKFNAWMLPSSEGKYEDGIADVRTYQELLANNKAGANVNTTDIKLIIIVILNDVIAPVNGKLTRRNIEVKFADDELGDYALLPLKFSEVDDIVFEAAGTAADILPVMSVLFHAFRDDLNEGVIGNFESAINATQAAANFNPPWIENGGLWGMAMDHRSDMGRYFGIIITQLEVVRDSIKN